MMELEFDEFTKSEMKKEALEERIEKEIEEWQREEHRYEKNTRETYGEVEL